jgi:MFS family permease
VAQPHWRGSAVGVYRLWRDLGFAVGAVAAGLLADAFNVNTAIAAVAALTFLSGLVVALVMRETLPGRASIGPFFRKRSDLVRGDR